MDLSLLVLLSSCITWPIQPKVNELKTLASKNYITIEADLGDRVRTWVTPKGKKLLGKFADLLANEE